MIDMKNSVWDILPTAYGGIHHVVSVSSGIPSALTAIKVAE